MAPPSQSGAIIVRTELLQYTPRSNHSLSSKNYRQLPLSSAPETIYSRHHKGNKELVKNLENP